MKSHRAALKTQKPRVGLLVCLAMVVTLGAGCSDSVNAAGESLKSAGATIQAKFEEMKATVAAWQATFAKAQAIYNILHSDDVPAPSEPAADENAAPTTDAETTPSVQPSEDQPQPATADSTTSQ